MDKLRFIKQHLEENFIVASLILLILFFGLISDNFFSVITLTTIVNQLPALTVVTIGITLVLIVGGIDLSVGSVMGFSAAVVGVATVGWGLPLPVACLVGLGAGLMCGLTNGVLVSYLAATVVYCHARHARDGPWPGVHHHEFADRIYRRLHSKNILTVADDRSLACAARCPDPRYRRPFLAHENRYGAIYHRHWH